MTSCEGKTLVYQSLHLRGLTIPLLWSEDRCTVYLYWMVDCLSADVRAWVLHSAAHSGKVVKSITRVSYETSFDSKQPKLDPKLVSTLSETRCLFRLFRFYIKTAIFGVSIEPKQNRNNRNKPKKVNLVAESCTFTSKISKS
jgi:hypothetical protein